MLLNQHMTPKRLRITSGIGVHKKTSLIDSVAKTGLEYCVACNLATQFKEA